MRQARLALHANGLLAAIEAWIAAIPGEAGVTARIEWEYANSVSRDSALVSALIANQVLSEEDLDNLISQAVGL
jgi:hypothetical protein